MRSRAAILPFPGDPFLLNYWLDLFDQRWGSEVDKLYVGLNSPIEPSVVEYIHKRIERSNTLAGFKKVILDYVPNQMDHGPTIDRLLDLVSEKYVMLVEDDGFIFKTDMVNWCFLQLEGGTADIVGSKRGSCAMEILTAAQNKWGINYEGEGDQGCNFWPNFFFISKELLLQTDRNFSAKAWHRGEVINGLNHTVESEIVHGDTMVNTSLQLRGIVPENRIVYVPQYHGHPDDLDHAREGKYLFDGKAPWTHIGSLSSGVGGILRDGNDRPLAQRMIKEPEERTQLPTQWCRTDFEHREFERRVQWWLTFYEYFGQDSYFASDVDTTKEFYDLYGYAIQQIIDQYGLAIGAIRKRQQVYRELLGI